MGTPALAKAAADGCLLVLQQGDGCLGLLQSNKVEQKFWSHISHVRAIERLEEVKVRLLVEAV